MNAAGRLQPPPGSMEMDLVANCDGVNRGSYVHSLVMTDISSAWTECCAPLVVREKSVLIEALEKGRGQPAVSPEGSRRR